MKGPFERLKYDLRRLWECPQCKRRERSDGAVTSRFCDCLGKGTGGQRTPMKLLEEAGHRTVPEVKCPPREEPRADESPRDQFIQVTVIEPCPETNPPSP